MSTVSRAERRRAAAAAAAEGRPHRRVADAAPGVLLVAILVLLGWLVTRGPLVAPISLYAASSSTVSVFSASHAVAALAALGAAAALVAIWRGRLALPPPAWLAGIGLPLLGAAVATARAVYPHDARYDLAVMGAVAVLLVAAASLLDGGGGGRSPDGRVGAALRPDGGGGGRSPDGGVGAALRPDGGGTEAPAAGSGAAGSRAAGSGTAGSRAARSRAAGSGTAGSGAAGSGAGEPAAAPGVGSPAPGGLALRLAVLGTALGGCIPAGMGLAQFASGRPTPLAWIPPAEAALIPVRAAATLHNPNVLAAVLLLCLGACLALALGGRARAVRWVALAAAVPETAALVLTFSRGAYLALAAAVLLVLVLAPRGRRLRALGAAGLMAATWLAVSGHVPGVVVRAGAMGIASAGDTASRFFTWTDALRVWLAHPWTGAGPGGLEVLYAALAPLGWHGNYVFTVVPSSADNDLLEWLAENGVAGLALLLGGVVLLAVALGRAVRRRGIDDRCLALPLAAVLLGLAVQGLFDVTAYVVPVLFLGAWVLALLTAACGCLVRFRLRQPVALAPVAAAAACVALALVLWGAWPRFAAYQAGYAPWSAGHPAAALPVLEAASRADPSSERAQASAGDAAVLALYQRGAAAAPATAAGWSQAARGHLAAALRLDPYDGAVWSVAEAYVARSGPSPAAACAAEAATRTRPYDPFLAYTLARQLDAVGQTAAGRLDAAYAAWVFPLTLAVMREHGQTGAEYHQGEAEMRAGLAAVGAAGAAGVVGTAGSAGTAGSGLLPHAPVEPLGALVCGPALTRDGLPAGAFRVAMEAGVRPEPRTGLLGRIFSFLARGRTLPAA